jgi:large subunit ribosomal protein L21
VYAVISDRSRQLAVRVGDVVLLDHSGDWSQDQEVTFDRVLLVSNEGEVKVGAPALEGATVTGVVLGPSKGEKVTVFRFKRRKNVRVKRGHRQRYVRVRITDIAV